MNLIIGGADHTSALQEGTLVLRHFGDLRSSFSATLFFADVPAKFPSAGQEIWVKEGDQILWGGILIEAEAECHSTTSATVQLRGQGYEQILQRYCLPSLQLSSMTPSNAAKYVFSNYLNPEDGLSLGTVDAGLSTQNEYQFHAGKASGVFDYLAAENGYRWWIDQGKVFHMRSFLPQKSGGKVIDLTEQDSNRLLDLQTLTYRESTAGYRNVQYAYNKYRYMDGKSQNFTEIAKMHRRYGSGEYGAATPSSVVVTQNDGQQVAAQALASASGLGELEFTTDNDVYSLGQVVLAKLPLFGIKETQRFCITEIRSVYFIDRFRYRIFARETANGTLSSSTWERALAGNTLSN